MSRAFSVLKLEFSPPFLKAITGPHLGTHLDRRGDGSASSIAWHGRIGRRHFGVDWHGRVWRRGSGVPAGHGRVQARCTWVTRHLLARGWPTRVAHSWASLGHALSWLGVQAIVLLVRGRASIAPGLIIAPHGR